jgi:putative transposase
LTAGAEPAREPDRTVLPAFPGISPHFRPPRHKLSAAEYRASMTDRFAVWDEIIATASTVA